MLRFLGFATLVLIAVCLAVSASIALADDGAAPAATAVRDRSVEGIDPDRRMIDRSLATIEGVHAFDFAVDTDVKPDPELDEPSAILGL